MGRSVVSIAPPYRPLPGCCGQPGELAGPRAADTGVYTLWRPRRVSLDSLPTTAPPLQVLCLILISVPDRHALD